MQGMVGFHLLGTLTETAYMYTTYLMHLAFPPKKSWELYFVKGVGNYSSMENNLQFPGFIGGWWVDVRMMCIQPVLI